MQPAWIGEYKREIDRGKRAAILVREKEEHGAETSYEIREKLFECRYDMKDGHELDYFIRGWMNMHALERQRFFIGEQRRVRKELDGIRKDWQFDLCAQYGEEGAEALYDELFNMTLLYIYFCESDSMYNSVLLGLGRMSEAKRKRKIALEVDKLTREIPEKVGATEELDVFIRAAKDALAYRFPEEAKAIAEEA